VPRASSKAAPRPTRPGAALLIATLIAVLLATAAAVLIDEARAMRMASSEALRLERARFQAESLSDAALVTLDAGLGGTLDGRRMDLPDALGAGEVRAQEAGGLVDLNAAPPGELAKLLVALGLDADQANTLADRIADWRDEDDLRHLLGAEAPEYRTAHLPAPENRPFTQELEVARVMGVSASLAHCLGPYLTVHSSQSYVDVGSAPTLLRETFALATQAGGSSPAGPPLGRVVILTAEAPISERAVYRLTRWVRLTGDANAPVLIHRAQADLAPAHETATASCASL
jgi:type II secretory pathway component PulK